MDSTLDALSFAQLVRRVRHLRSKELAVVDGNVRLTWAELTDRVFRLAGALRDAGLEDGDRVGLISNNGHRFTEFYLGVPWAGGVFTPLNTRLAVAELVTLVRHAGIQILLADAANHATAREVATKANVKTLIVASEDVPAAQSYEALLARAAPRPDAGRRGDDTAGLFYTSGSTGQPKGVMLTHANFIMAGLNFIGVHGMTEDSVALLSSPLFHVGASALCIPAMTLGATMVTVPKFVPEDVARAIDAHHVTIMTAVPTTLRMMLDEAAARNLDLSSLEVISYGGAPMPEPLQADLARALPRAKLIQGYGMTELTAGVTALPHAYVSPERRALGKARSVGRAMPCCDLQVFGPDDEPVALGEIGEVVVRGPIMMKGYWKEPELTARTLRGGWMHTGDLGYLDADAFLHLAGRSKDMIITGGENVYPSEVEDVIAKLPGVLSCVVFGAADPKWGEAVRAVLVVKDPNDLTEERVTSHCREHLAGYKCPRRVYFQTEPLPVSGANKIDRAAVKAAHAS